MRRHHCTSLLILATTLAVTGCQTNTGKDTGIGALVGGGVGALAGGAIKGVSGTEGAIAGALVGGLLGHMHGSSTDEADAQQQQINSLQAQVNSQTVNVTNSNGSTTPVVLHKAGTQWQGPRGESYRSLPGASQLAPIYGI